MLAHGIDPEELKKEILNKVGDLDDVVVMGNRIMVAVYIRPQKTKSGIYLTDRFLDEDEYQGKVCLVLKKGPLAFKSDQSINFNGQDVNVGDWILVPCHNRKNFKYNDVLCAHVEDVHIDQIIQNPDLYY